MLADLIHNDPDMSSGLYAYLQHMLAVMAFDAGRRGRWISAPELAEYTFHLATAVTEALHYFIGHCFFSPHNEARYLAASAAHITHMLRDTFEDNAAGYYNIPGEYLERHRLAPQDVECKPYRAWVSERVHLAREQIQAGKEYLTQVESLRCRIAGYAYLARFEVVLEVIEREGFNLRAEYRERKRLGAWIKVCWSAVSSAFGSRRKEPIPGIPSAIKYHKR
jgi:phytoene/squalene synthetase